MLVTSGPGIADCEGRWCDRLSICQGIEQLLFRLLLWDMPHTDLLQADWRFPGVFTGLFSVTIAPVLIKLVLGCIGGLRGCSQPASLEFVATWAARGCSTVSLYLPLQIGRAHV